MTRTRWMTVAAIVLLLLGALGLRTLGAGTLTTAAEAFDAERPGDALTVLRAPTPLPRSAASLHDEGVAWYRAGDTARAIGAWRAARALAPRDPDLVHNLAVARAELEGTPTPVEAPYGWMDVVTPGELGLMALVAWAVFSGSMIGWRRRREGLEAAVVAGLIAIALSSMAWTGRQATLEGGYVVTTEAALVRDGPALDAGERFSLPLGSELIMVAHRGPFVLVEDGDGRRGWALQTQLFAAEGF